MGGSEGLSKDLKSRIGGELQPIPVLSMWGTRAVLIYNYLPDGLRRREPGKEE